MKQLNLMIIILLCNITYSQKKELRTNSNTISIKDGEYFYKNIWKTNTNLKLDIYYPLTNTNEKEISFISDIDTISFNVKKNKKYNFDIVDSKGRCAKTQINLSKKRKATLTKLPLLLKFKNDQKSDTINFELVKNRIHLKLKVNNYEKELDFLFDTGANENVISTSLNESFIMFTDTVSSKGAYGKHKVLKSHNNTIHLNNIKIENIGFIKNNYKGSRKFDGILGYNNFINHIIEIDFVNKKFIISKNITKNKKGYEKIKMKRFGGLFFIPLKIKLNEKLDLNLFANFDTGSDSNLKITKGLFLKNNIKLNKISTARANGSSGKFASLTIYKLPILKLGKFELKNTKIEVFDKQSKHYKNNLGCNLIRRFNLILDYQKMFFYFKPNNIYNLEK